MEFRLFVLFSLFHMFEITLFGIIHMNCHGSYDGIHIPFSECFKYGAVLFEYLLEIVITFIGEGTFCMLKHFLIGGKQVFKHPIM